MEKLKVVTLCGSMKFIDTFNELREKMVAEGIVCFTPEIFSIPDNLRNKLDEDMHRKLDILHQTKMILSDEILIVDVGGYIGDNTREEIEYAEKEGLHISYYSKLVKNN